MGRNLEEIKTLPRRAAARGLRAVASLARTDADLSKHLSVCLQEVVQEPDLDLRTAAFARRRMERYGHRYVRMLQRADRFTVWASKLER